MSHNCLTCCHLSRDAEKLLVCEKVYGAGLLGCGKCNQIDVSENFALSFVPLGFIHAACGKHQGVLVKNDWREGYLGNPVDCHLTPLPCCPGWEKPPEAKKPLAAQRNLFDLDSD